ncbi:hypothetical protein PGIGA_G00195990 [Pangasianodon gigas]|uniref:Uncharacterized protein n=1 Tax=Pangasianodon gigas TaxID=30993 RepID=A0ACC5XWR8_PANGG|nr:hypothetical protein [Pangasianodon gigas]
MNLNVSTEAEQMCCTMLTGSRTWKKYKLWRAVPNWTSTPCQEQVKWPSSRHRPEELRLRWQSPWCSTTFHCLSLTT